MVNGRPLSALQARNTAPDDLRPPLFFLPSARATGMALARVEKVAADSTAGDVVLRVLRMDGASA